MTSAHRQSLLRYTGIWATWLLVALVTAFQTYAAGFAGGPRFALRQALLNGLLWYSVWAILTPGVVAVARAFVDERRLGRLFLIHLAFGLVFAALHALLYSAMNAIIYFRSPWAPWTGALLLVKLATSIHVHLMIYAIIVAIVLGAHAYRTMRDRAIAAGAAERAAGRSAAAVDRSGPIAAQPAGARTRFHRHLSRDRGGTAGEEIAGRP